MVVCFQKRSPSAQSHHVKQQNADAHQHRLMREIDHKAVSAQKAERAQTSAKKLLRPEPAHDVPQETAEEKHKNPLNNAHGGVLYTLCDTISGVAGASYGGGGATVQSSVSFLRPATGGLLTCRARVRKDGRKLIWVDCSVTGEDGKELCTGQFLYMQMPGIAHFGIEKEAPAGTE